MKDILRQVALFFVVCAVVGVGVGFMISIAAGIFVGFSKLSIYL